MSIFLVLKLVWAFVGILFGVLVVFSLIAVAIDKINEPKRKEQTKKDFLETIDCINKMIEKLENKQEKKEKTKKEDK